MKLAFALFNYFPFGGLQKQCMNIAIACRDRGHQVEFFVGRWEGEQPDWAPVHQVPFTGMTNQARNERFAREFQRMIAGRGFDCRVGFNRMPGLDVYYAADECFKEKALQNHGFWYRLTPRYRHFAAYEEAIYGSASQTRILLIAEVEKPKFIKHYQTDEGRFYSLPPGISQACMAGDDALAIRQAKREELGLTPQDHAIFFIGSGFVRKGLDRAIEMLALLPQTLRNNCRLFVVGDDDFDQYKAMAARQGLASQVLHLGGRNDVPQLLQAADALVHPAYNENTGNVILESIVAGLPLLATETCGYSHYIREVDAGIELAAPWDSRLAANALEELLCSDKRPQWRENGIRFGQQNDLYHRADRAVGIIEESCRKPG